jgi:hypothetical protein
LQNSKPNRKRVQSPKEEKKGHLGVQLASYLLSRATIQTAVVLAAGLGTKQKKDKKYRHAACELQLGALRLEHPVLDMSLEHVYETEAHSRHKRSFKNWFKRSLKSHGLRKSPKPDDWGFAGRNDLEVDLVLTPIDGAGALWDGESGSVSVAAVAARRTDGKEAFLNPCPEATGFLAIAVGPQHAKLLEPVDKVLEEIGKSLEGKSLNDLQNAFPLLETIVVQLKTLTHPVLGVMFDPYEKFKPQGLDAMQCLRRLQGSAFAAALAAFVKKVPYSIFFSRLPQMFQAAIAARGTGGRLYAIPLVDKSSGERMPDYRHVKVPVGKVVRETDLLKTTNAVVVCTSISEICVLDRVRFSDEGIATTDSIAISLLSGRTSRQVDQVPLDWIMRGPDGGEATGRELIEAYKRFLPEVGTSIENELAGIRNRAWKK